DESAEARDERRLTEWITGRGGTVAVRDVQMGCRWLKEPGVAETALQGLVNAGYGAWVSIGSSPLGGRPSRLFKLASASTVNETPPHSAENNGFVDVDSVDTPKRPDLTPDAEEWGEL